MTNLLIWFDLVPEPRFQLIKAEVSGIHYVVSVSAFVS